MPILSGELGPAVETSSEVALHLVLHPLDSKAVGVLDCGANVFTTKEMGLPSRLTHVDAAELWVIGITYDVCLKLRLELCRARHLEVVDVDDKVAATLGVPVA